MIWIFAELKHDVGITVLGVQLTVWKISFFFKITRHLCLLKMVDWKRLVIFAGTAVYNPSLFWLWNVRLRKELKWHVIPFDCYCFLEHVWSIINDLKTLLKNSRSGGIICRKKCNFQYKGRSVACKDVAIRRKAYNWAKNF